MSAGIPVDYKTGLWRKTGKHGEFFKVVDRDNGVEIYLNKNVSEKENAPAFTLTVKALSEQAANATPPAKADAAPASPTKGFSRPYAGKKA